MTGSIERFRTIRLSPLRLDCEEDCDSLAETLCVDLRDFAMIRLSPSASKFDCSLWIRYSGFLQGPSQKQIKNYLYYRLK